MYKIQQLKLNQADQTFNFAKRKEVNSTDANRIKWRRMLHLNETVENRLLVSHGPKTF